MLTLISTIIAAAVAIAAFVTLRRGLKNKDLTDPPKDTVETVVQGLESVPVVTEVAQEPKTDEEPKTNEVVVEVSSPKEVKSARANSRARNKGRFKADNPATPDNEAYKGGKRTRVQVKK